MTVCVTYKYQRTALNLSIVGLIVRRFVKGEENFTSGKNRVGGRFYRERKQNVCINGLLNKRPVLEI